MCVVAKDKYSRNQTTVCTDAGHPNDLDLRLPRSRQIFFCRHRCSSHRSLQLATPSPMQAVLAANSSAHLKLGEAASQSGNDFQRCVALCPQIGQLRHALDARLARAHRERDRLRNKLQAIYPKVETLVGEQMELAEAACPSPPLSGCSREEAAGSRTSSPSPVSPDSPPHLDLESADGDDDDSASKGKSTPVVTASTPVASPSPSSTSRKRSHSSTPKTVAVKARSVVSPKRAEAQVVRGLSGQNQKHQRSTAASSKLAAEDVRAASRERR